LISFSDIDIFMWDRFAALEIIV